jgi:hypothetical protein
VRKATFCIIALAAAITLGARDAKAQANLNANQGALYLACIGASTVGNLPVNLTPNLYVAAILTNQQTISQAESITSLQNMTFVQLGTLIQTNMKTYGVQELDCQGGRGNKCTGQVMTLFLTQNPASCLSIASGYAP